MSEGEKNLGSVSTTRVLWTRFALRHWRREPGTTALLIGILALGVAVFLAVRLANKAAVTGFAFFTESISGESDMLLRAPAGTLDVEILPELRAATGTDPVGIFPVLEVSAADASEPDGAILNLVGIDLVAIRSSAGLNGGAGEADGAEEESMLGRSDLAFVGESFAGARGLVAGDAFEIVLDDETKSLKVNAVVPNDPNRPEIPENLVLMDLPGLWNLAGGEKELTRVEFRIPEGTAREEILGRVKGALSDFARDRELILQTPEDRKASVTTMSAAFRMNLGILSGLALIVGIYLILQAMEAAVIKRQAEIAIMRSLGVTPGQIRRVWFVESVVLGVAGSLLGVLLGWLLALGLVGAIARTVNTIYYQTTSDAVTLSLGEIAFAVGFGTIASIIAAIIPSREAASTPPAQTMRKGAQGGGLSVLRNNRLGIALTVVGIACAWIPPFVQQGMVIPVGGYIAAVLSVAGFSILIGNLYLPVSKFLRKGKSAPMKIYAASQLRRPEGRHRLTAAGLAVAIGMSAAMGILVASFENTLTSWINHLLKADIYVAAAGASSVANENTISERTWRDIEKIPGVAGLDKLRHYIVTLDGREVFLGGSDYNADPSRFLQLIWLEEPEQTGPDALSRSIGELPVAWVSEPFSRRFEVGKIDRIEFPTPDGEKTAVVTGVYADYGSEAGTILVSRSLTKEWFNDNSVSRIAVYADGDAEAVLEEIQTRHPTLAARTNSNLRSESLRIFHQTFAVTYALEAIAVIIAVLGLGLALTGLLLERKTELTTLREIGATRRDIARAAMWEGIGIAAVGIVGGLAMSFVLGWILIFVINPQSFGWTLGYKIPWWSFLWLSSITLFVAAVVAWFVGKKNANLRSDIKE